MNREGVLIDYISCVPTEEQKKSIEGLLEDLYCAVASESVIKAAIHKINDYFECQLRITSIYFSEIVTAKSDRIIPSTVYAKKAMLKKINRWKLYRFEDQAI